LYQKYREFCNENGEYVRSTSDFYAALEQAGFKKQKLRSGQMVIGLQIRFDFLD
jgi:putative DNA primase/helicase